MIELINWKELETKWLCLSLKHRPCFCVEVLRKTTENLSQDGRSQGWDLKPRPSQY
jgi:hypothetical protein